MDGYVSKPIQPEHLWQLIAAVVPNSQPNAAPPDPSIANVLDEEMLHECCGGDTKRSYRVGLKRRFVEPTLLVGMAGTIC